MRLKSRLLTGHGILQNHDVNQPGITAVGKVVLCLTMQAGAPLP